MGGHLDIVQISQLQKNFFLSMVSTDDSYLI